MYPGSATGVEVDGLTSRWLDRRTILQERVAEESVLLRPYLGRVQGDGGPEPIADRLNANTLHRLDTLSRSLDGQEIRDDPS